MTEEKKPNWLDAIKKAAQNKRSVPQSKTQEVQQAKFGNRVMSNKPAKRSAGRGR